MAPKNYGDDSDDDSDDAEWHQQQELENQKEILSRKMRILDSNKHKQADQSSRISMIQEARLQLLKNENEELTTTVDVVECDRNVERSQENTFMLTNLTEDMESLNAKAKEEELNIARMEKELKEIDDRLLMHRGLAVPTDVLKAKLLIQRTHTMEYAQGHAVVRFNNKLAGNYKFRESIESIRKVKSKFDVLYRRINHELKRIRTDIVASTEEASWRYRQRDEAQAKITALEERRDKDMLDYNAEMKEMQRIIAYDNTLKEFMAAKANDRHDYKQEEETKKRRNIKPDRDTEAEKNEKELSGIVASVCPDIEEILDKFQERKAECFALFNYVNDLSDEVDRLHELLHRMETNVQCMETEEVHQDSERMIRQSYLKERLERAKYEAKEAYKENEDMRCTMMEISKIVNKLFWDLECSRDEIDNMLAADSGVTDRNLITYMGIIEQQTIELLQAKKYTQLKKLGPEEFDRGKVDPHDRDATKKVLQNVAVKHTYTVIPPIIADMDMEELPRPVSVSQLRIMLLKKKSSTTSGSMTSSSSTSGSPRVSDASSEQLDDQDEENAKEPPAKKHHKKHEKQRRWQRPTASASPTQTPTQSIDTVIDDPVNALEATVPEEEATKG